MERTWARKTIDLIFANSHIVILAFLFLLISGLFSLFTLRTEGFPEVTINTVLVSVPYPGATASQVEEQVLKPVENALEDLEDVTEYRTTANNSFGVAVVTFKDSADPDEFISKLNAAMAKIKLPENTEEPEVQEFTADAGGDFMIAVTGPASPWELLTKATQIKDQLENVKGVTAVKFINPLTRQVAIEIDEAKLAAAGISREQVEGAIKAAQLDLPLGSFINSDEVRVNVGLTKNIPDVTALADLPISPTLKLKDVARLEVRLNNNDFYNRIGYRESEDVAGKMNLQRSLMMSISAKDDVDILEVNKELEETYERLTSQSEYSNVKILDVFNQAEDTRKQVDEIKAGLIGAPIEGLGSFGFLGYLFGGLGLIVLLLLLFINLRAAILAAISIPISLLAGLTFLWFAGIPLNTIVLFSMILVIGLVVDPTLVFLEAMYRYRQQGLNGRDAAVKTLSTVGFGMALAVITNFIVFVPFGVVSGFFGDIIKYIPLTVIPPLVASLLVPIVFFVPLASRFLTAKEVIGSDENPELVGVWGVSKNFGRGVRRILAPTRGMAFVRTLIILLAIAAPVAVGAYFVNSGQVKMVQFSSTADSDFVIIDGQVDDKWSFTRAISDVADPVQGVLANQPEIERFAYFSQQGNSFTIFAKLYSSADRKDRDLRTAEVLTKDLNENFKGIEEATVEASVSQAGPPQDRYPVKIQIFDNDLAKLEHAVEDISAYLKAQDSVEKVDDTLGVNNPSVGSTALVLKNDLSTANPMPFFGLVRNRLNENKVATLKLAGEEFEILSYVAPKIGSVDDITNLRLPQGTLNDVIAERKDIPSQSIQRLNGSRFVEVRAKLKEGEDPIKAQAALTDYLNEDKLSELKLEEDATESKGESDAIMKSFGELFKALAIAIFMIYIILVGFLRSFLLPIVILFAVPLGFVAVFPALAVATGQLGFLELLGVVAMAGVVVNVTILLIDFANQLKAEGYSPADAISAAVAVRFRPILLTKLTILGGLLPLMIYSPMWRGLAVVMLFGIIASGLLSLITTPILYMWVQGRRPKSPRPVLATEPIMMPSEPTYSEPISLEPESEYEYVPLEETPIEQMPPIVEQIPEEVVQEEPKQSQEGPTEEEIRELLSRIGQNRPSDNNDQTGQ